ncbi:hypothetical protein QOT17_019654 [Balamuthia mandrillaris]
MSGTEPMYTTTTTSTSTSGNHHPEYVEGVYGQTSPLLPQFHPLLVPMHGLSVDNSWLSLHSTMEQGGAMPGNLPSYLSVGEGSMHHHQSMQQHQPQHHYPGSAAESGEWPVIHDGAFLAGPTGAQLPYEGSLLSSSEYDDAKRSCTPPPVHPFHAGSLSQHEHETSHPYSRKSSGLSSSGRSQPHLTSPPLYPSNGGTSSMSTAAAAAADKEFDSFFRSFFRSDLPEQYCAKSEDEVGKAAHHNHHHHQRPSLEDLAESQLHYSYDGTPGSFSTFILPHNHHHSSSSASATTAASSTSYYHYQGEESPLSDTPGKVFYGEESPSHGSRPVVSFGSFDSQFVREHSLPVVGSSDNEDKNERPRSYSFPMAETEEEESRSNGMNSRKRPPEDRIRTMASELPPPITPLVFYGDDAEAVATAKDALQGLDESSLNLGYGLRFMRTCYGKKRRRKDPVRPSPTASVASLLYANAKFREMSMGASSSASPSPSSSSSDLSNVAAQYLRTRQEEEKTIAQAIAEHRGGMSSAGPAAPSHPDTSKPTNFNPTQASAGRSEEQTANGKAECAAGSAASFGHTLGGAAPSCPSSCAQTSQQHK